MSLMARRLAARYGENHEELDAPLRSRRSARRCPEMEAALTYIATHPLDRAPPSYALHIDKEEADKRSLLDRLLGGAT